LLDTCGTGGDDSGSFNISTTAAFVAAGAGIKVAKHGNRAMTSRAGSADVLEALGVKIDLGPEGVERCLEEVGIGFMFAPVFHPAMKFAGGPRREIGIRTVFNILGPLTNPAGAESQLLGVADPTLVEKMAQALKMLGSRHAMVVHGSGGLDELSISGPSTICELKDGQLTTQSIQPEDYGITTAEMTSVRGGTAEENAATLRSVLGGVRGPLYDVVTLNAAAALVAADMASSLQEGHNIAQDVIGSGAALAKVDQLVEFSQSIE
jgi:anthranilate phosphoribosyltransferase